MNHAERQVERQAERAAERAAERRAATGFVVSALGALALAVVYAAGGQPQWEGALLVVTFGGLCYGLVVWANRLLPQGPFAEDRKPLGTTEADREAFEDDLEREGTVGRRTLLLRTLGLAVAAIGAMLVFPVRSLGPGPGRSLLRTAWRGGARLVTEEGALVMAGEVPADGLVTVFPEGHAGSGDAQAVLVRVDPGLLRAAPGREDWTPNGLVAYSKVCTHAGCPIGLYQAATRQLLCPCHQSAFDVLDRAKPVFGPAAWPLPQLPLDIDADGVVRSTGDFSEPVGPGYWKVG